MGSSGESPDKICFEEGSILEDLAADGPDLSLPSTGHLVEGHSDHIQ